MDISDVNDNLAKIALPGDQKGPLLRLIDTKINNDMKEVIAEIRRVEEILGTKIQMVHDKLSNEIKIMYCWVIGIALGDHVIRSGEEIALPFTAYYQSHLRGWLFPLAVGFHFS